MSRKTQSNGASDPEFNLRRDAAFMIQRSGVKRTAFVSIIEAHGSYSPVPELALNSNSNISALKVVYDDANYIAVSIEDLEGHTGVFILSKRDESRSKQHQLKIGSRAYHWTGLYRYTDT